MGLKNENRKKTLAIYEKKLSSGKKNNRPKSRLKDGTTISKQKKDNPIVNLTSKDKLRLQTDIQKLKEKIK